LRETKICPRCKVRPKDPEIIAYCRPCKYELNNEWRKTPQGKVSRKKNSIKQRTKPAAVAKWADRLAGYIERKEDEGDY